MAQTFKIRKKKYLKKNKLNDINFMEWNKKNKKNNKTTKILGGSKKSSKFKMRNYKKKSFNSYSTGKNTNVNKKYENIGKIPFFPKGS